MSDGHAQLALREWRALFARPVPLAIMAAVAGLLAILAPFETERYLELPGRFAYWLVMVFGTYSVGLLINTILAAAIPATWPMPAKVAVTGLATGFGITPVVIVVNLVAFDYIPRGESWLPFLGQLLAISVIVTLIFRLLAPRLAAHSDTGEAAPAPPPILDRLPLDKRGALLSLSSEDHYTRVRTSRGEDLILIRLGDAIREVGETEGMRVHRSHWVATAAITAVERRGDGALLTLSSGGEVPVSRSNIPAIRAAGLLPR